MPSSPNGEFNICGVLVQARPEKLEATEKTITEFPGVDIHGKGEDGALVITIEDTEDEFASETLMKINQVDGVLAATLVYHHCEPIEELESEAI